MLTPSIDDELWTLIEPLLLIPSAEGGSVVDERVCRTGSRSMASCSCCARGYAGTACQASRGLVQALHADVG